MSNVITLLERMGRDAQLRHAAQSDLQRELEHAEIAPELMAAILAGDQMQLEKLLGQSNVCCAFMPSKEDEEEEESPSREDEISLASKVRFLASVG